jgi:linoleoyl-CoA desaturase
MDLEPSESPHDRFLGLLARGPARFDVLLARGPARFDGLGRELDALRARALSSVGELDVRRVKRLRRLSRFLALQGRTLIHFSFEPFSFGAGVLALWLHKQLEAVEIGHTALHGAYDKFASAPAFHAERFSWLLPIDEESWRQGHNLRHHGYTNVAGKDPDMDYGVVRLSEHSPHRAAHYLQLPLMLAVMFPNTAVLMNLHFSGVIDLWFENGLGESKLNVLRDRSPASVRTALRRSLRKLLPYYAREYLLFPALAGPFFAKVLFGNWLSEVFLNAYSAAAIFCGHVGGEVASYPAGTKAHSRGEWYAMQIQASNNFAVPTVLSVLCGGLDYQIEHHLFPTLPPARLREIAPEVRAICKRHGIAYRRDSWPSTLGKALAQIARLSNPRGATCSHERAEHPTSRVRITLMRAFGDIRKATRSSEA